MVHSSHLDINKPAESVYHWSRALETPKVSLLANNREIILRFGEEYKEGEGEVGALVAVGKRLYLRCSDKYV